MDTITAVIETPKGNAEKYKYDPKTKFFKLKKICTLKNFISHFYFINLRF